MKDVVPISNLPIAFKSRKAIQAQLPTKARHTAQAKVLGRQLLDQCDAMENPEGVSFLCEADDMRMPIRVGLPQHGM